MSDSFNHQDWNVVNVGNGGKINKKGGGIDKQAMLQKLQDDYKQVGTLFDDSPYNIEGAQMQGIDTVHLRKNDDYWAQHPERVYPYGI